MRGYRAAAAALIVSIVACAVLAGAPAPSLAAPDGLAWDSVTRLVTNADTSSLQPASFDADYAAAASASPPNMGAAAMFLGKDRVAAAQTAEQMIKSGLAERHYIAGSKERT